MPARQTLRAQVPFLNKGGKKKEMAYELDQQGERLWFSPKLNNGDFDYWLVIEIVDLFDAVGEDEPEQFLCEVGAVSPQQAEASIRSALECIGMETETELSDEQIVYALWSHGTYAPLWHKTGNDEDALKADAEEQLPVLEMMFGFYMDRRVNAIGSTGWDFIKGDITAGLRRYGEDRDEEPGEQYGD